MIVEMRTYTTLPGKVQEILELYDREGREVQVRFLGHMVGYYHTEIGPLNQLVHMWGYDDLEDRARRRARLQEDASWREYVANLMPLLTKMESQVLVPAPFFNSVPMVTPRSIHR